MRPKAELKLGKTVGRFENLKYICWSIAEKHKHWLHQILQFTRGSFLTESMEVGGQSRCINMVEESQDIKKELTFLCVSDDAVIHEWLPAWNLHFS